MPRDGGVEKSPRHTPPRILMFAPVGGLDEIL